MIFGTAGWSAVTFPSEARIELVPMDERTASLAIKAIADYGRGRGHPAQLNPADCFSYACAKALGISLLYKGRDFAKTDLAGPA
ncbi:type II toxin-antitoxin system VapC family toxin [Rhizobium sullae]|uniref:PIN domain-containing protein n=2 Tax=Rhizobium sullae TaxID=50338 RepID=A0A2N0D2I5_RHISU|nr:type II toxin-antitoxin system VapC family toxin [Rhizobium sullae]PKA40262.1 PIN domain-containing protein [Rhizobium sullae]